MGSLSSQDRCYPTADKLALGRDRSLAKGRHCCNLLPSGQPAFGPRAANDVAPPNVGNGSKAVAVRISTIGRKQTLAQ